LKHEYSLVASRFPAHGIAVVDGFAGAAADAALGRDLIQSRDQGAGCSALEGAPQERVRGRDAGIAALFLDARGQTQLH